MSLEELCEEWRRRSRIFNFTAYLEVTRKTKEVKWRAEADVLTKDILNHANPELTEQRSVGAQILVQRMKNEMKRRRTGATYTDWHTLLT